MNGAFGAGGVILILGLLASPDAIAQAQRTAPEGVPEGVVAPADLDLLDPPVREQYRSLHSRLEGLLVATTTPASTIGEAYGALGMWYLAYDYFEPARLALGNAIVLAPAEHRWRYYLAHAERQLGLTSEAIASLRAYLRAVPRPVPAVVWLARLERDAGRDDEARRLLELALEIEPLSVAARFELGRLLLDNSEVAASIHELEKALAGQPEAPSIHYALGLAYRAAGDVERARRHLEQARVEERDRVEPRLDDPLMDEVRELATGSKARSRRADWLFAKGRFEEAAVEYRRAHEARPDDPSIWANLGLALEMAGQPRAALETLSALAARFPGFAGARVNLGGLLSRNGDFKGAAAQYLMALEIDPGALEARDGLASLLVAAGRPDEALDQYRRIVDLDPANERARFREAVLLVVLERYQEALLALARGHETLPASQPLRLLLARVLVAAPEESLRDAERAIGLVEDAGGDSASAPPGDTAFLLETEAMVEAERGRFEQALAAQRQALALFAASTGEAERIRRRLEHYLERRPCRRPYEIGELTL